MPMMKILFRCSSLGARMKSSVAMLKPVKVMINVRNAREITVKVKNGYVINRNRTMKTVFMGNLSHLIILSDYINRLYK